MLKNFKIISNHKDRVNLVILFFMLLVSTFVEMLGIGSIPIFASIIVDPDIILTKLPKQSYVDYINKLDKKLLTFYCSIFILFIFLIKNLYLTFLNYFNGIVERNLQKKYLQHFVQYLFKSRL